jgi:hypothetical protein
MRNRGLAATYSIERISAPTQERFYEGYVKPAIPVIIEDAIEGWRATTHWSGDYLKAVTGHRRVPVEVSPDHEFAVPERFDRDLVHTTFDRYIDYLLRPDVPHDVTYYLAQLNMSRYVPDLRQDVVRPHFIPPSDYVRAPFLWMGRGRNASTLHYDSYDNLYVLLSGRKHITLFPPGDREYLYPYNVPRRRHFSRVNMRRPDLEQFPKLEHTRPYECVLCHGDMLYIPFGWWHYLRSHGLNVAVNWWWVEPDDQEAA